jgi:transcriptional regulator with XRE-family HTH domain
MPNLGDRLREALDRSENKKAKKNVPYLASKAEVSKQNIYNILDGTNNNPNDEILKVIAGELNIDFIYLKYGDEGQKVYYSEPAIFNKLPNDLKEFVVSEENTPYIVFAKQLKRYDLEKMLENIKDTDMQFLLSALYMHLKKDSTK